MQNTTLSFSDLVRSVARKHDLTQTAMSDIIRSVFAEIHENVVNNNCDVNIPDFGKFKKKSRAARTCRNPLTGAPIEAPAFATIGYHPSRTIRVTQTASKKMKKA